MWENLRILKLIPFFPSIEFKNKVYFTVIIFLKKVLKIQFDVIFSALRKILNPLIVVGIVIIAYSFFGVFLFKGKLENRCRMTILPFNNSWPINPNISDLCGVNICVKG